MSNRAQYNLALPRPVPMGILTDKLTAAGLPCRAQTERGRWRRIQFDTHKSDGLAYTQGEDFDVVLFNFDAADVPSLPKKVEQVMRSIGFTQEQPALWKMVALPLLPWAVIVLLAFGVWRAAW